MNALEAFRHHRADTEQTGALGGPVTARARTVLLTGEDNARRARRDLCFGRIEDAGLFAIHQGVAAFHMSAIFLFGLDEVPDQYVGERATQHDFVVAPARPVGVEISALDTLFLQPGARRGGFGEGSGW